VLGENKGIDSTVYWKDEVAKQDSAIPEVSADIMGCARLCKPEKVIGYLSLVSL
jgi:hypothetical protein